MLAHRLNLQWAGTLKHAFKPPRPRWARQL
jgi:hypothetical protein